MGSGSGARPTWTPGRILGFGAAAAVIVAVAVSCTSVGSSLKQVGAGVRHAPGKTYQVAGPVTSLSLDTAGGVTVTGGTSETGVTVSEDPSYSKTPPVTSHDTAANGTLALGYTCETQLVCKVDYTITVPRGTAVRVTSRESSVTLTGLSGSVTAQTFAGLLTATGLTSPTATLKSTVGGVNATFAAAPESVTASTTAGPISLAVPGSAAYQANADAVVGTETVKVRRDPASPHVITAHSTLGSITISPA